MTVTMTSGLAVACPFNSPAYAESLAHIGRPQHHASAELTVLRRPVPSGTHHDGVSPWPYLWISDDSQLQALRVEFKDLVSLAVVCQPGYLPPAGDAVLLKQHYVFDPALPTPSLSRRAQRRLDVCRDIAEFEEVPTFVAADRFHDMYRTMVERRGLTGGFFDMGLDHFRTIARVPGSLFVQVRSGTRVGAMACGIRFGRHLQLLHTVMSADGLTWNASYLLMKGLQELAIADDRLLLTGGLPTAARPGLRTFKERWANATTPVHLLRIVNDADEYARLCRGAPATCFFPAYRSV